MYLEPGSRSPAYILTLATEPTPNDKFVATSLKFKRRESEKNVDSDAVMRSDHRRRGGS